MRTFRPARPDQPLASDWRDSFVAKLRELDSDPNLRGSVPRRLNALLRDLPADVVPTARFADRLGLDEHERAYFLLNAWQRMHAALHPAPGTDWTLLPDNGGSGAQSLEGLFGELEKESQIRHYWAPNDLLNLLSAPRDYYQGERSRDYFYQDWYHLRAYLTNRRTHLAWWADMQGHDHEIWINGEGPGKLAPGRTPMIALGTYTSSNPRYADNHLVFVRHDSEWLFSEDRNMRELFEGHRNFGTAQLSEAPSQVLLELRNRLAKAVDELNAPDALPRPQEVSALGRIQTVMARQRPDTAYVDAVKQLISDIDGLLDHRAAKVSREVHAAYRTFLRGERALVAQLPTLALVAAKQRLTELEAR
jgi:hypothetical protein